MRKRRASLRQPMITAVTGNDVAAVTTLLDGGADVNARNAAGETAFSYACTYDAFDVARLLHARGADVNTIDRGNGSPLDWAVGHASPEFVAWLESVGARRHDVGPETAPEEAT